MVGFIVVTWQASVQRSKFTRPFSNACSHVASRILAITTTVVRS